MIRTIIIGSCVSIQGTFVRSSSGGKIIIAVGNQAYEGKPVEAPKKPSIKSA